MSALFKVRSISLDQNQARNAFLGYAIFATLLALMNSSTAWAAKHSAKNWNNSSESESRSYSSSGPKEMFLDVSAHYVRDTKPEGLSGTAGRFSIGGMFNPWLGLDLQTLYEIKSKSYLVGADMRIAPTDWFFLKGGLGGYAHKETRQFRITPVAGGGILARLSREYYFVTETSYFQVNGRSNVSFGGGFGISF
ncbi:MAG: hypothetical protein AB1540_11325 [Bdellovibrionota bacterium]